MIGFSGHTLPQPALEIVEQPDSPGPDDPVWEKPWLFGLLDVPPDATWPRYMTVPHPHATGSYGASAIEWLFSYGGIDLRWWQKLALTRELEHDDRGALLWMEVLLTTARQVGKSVCLGAAAMWRLHQAERFGEEQMILHTGKDLAVCKEIQRPARTWAKGIYGYQVFEGSGNISIVEPKGSRWLVRAQESVYGYSVSNALVDEAWALRPGVVDEGLEPTMAERSSPQLVLASTAHRSATGLVPTRRQGALDNLAEPDATLLLEWSAPRDTDIDDRQAWRAASPHWGKNRERLLEKQVARVHADETLDPDEIDPVESFRAQYLNVWPVRTSSNPGAVLIDSRVWTALVDSVDTTDARVFVAVEDNHGKGAAVAACAVGPDGRYELDGWLVPDWVTGFDDVDGIAATRERTQLTVGAALVNETDGRFRAKVATASDTRAGLALLRQLVATGRLVHDGAPDLDQLTQVHVRELPGGMTIVSGHRADLVRAAAWAVLAAYETQPEPSIR